MFRHMSRSLGIKHVTAGADSAAMRSVMGLCVTMGTLGGGYLPVLWGDSGFSLVSLLCGGLGGLAGVWVAIRLQT